MIGQHHTIALLPWGNVLEDFLEPLGVSLETYCTEFRGSWVFGYVEALRRVGLETVIYCISTQVTKPSRFQHRPTGATICVLPVPNRYKVLRRRMQYPYGQSVQHMFGDIRGVRILLLPLLFFIRETVLYLATPHRLLAQEIGRDGCDVILCQEYEYPRFDACVLLGKLMGIPVFATFQGGNYHHSHLERFLRPHSLRACAGLIIASSTEMKRVRSRYEISDKKFEQIFNPVDLRNWIDCDREAARAALGIPDNASLVAWHGRISIHKKGLDILLKAWDCLRRKCPDQDVRLLVIGAGEGDEEFRQRLTSMSVPGVIWIDKFIHDPAIIRQYLSAADVYAFPSRYEGFPVALIEAMACGLPVVATAINGALDILDGRESHGGIIVPPEDAESFALALSRVLSNKSWARALGNSARRRVEERCSYEAVGQKLYSFIFNE